jgi:excisionase family DNA binding protein
VSDIDVLIALVCVRGISPMVEVSILPEVSSWREHAASRRPDRRSGVGGKIGRWSMAAHGMQGESEVLLTPAEVASLFRVDPKTVTRWAKAGKLSYIRTLGGHRRYPEAEVRALLGAASGKEPEANQD